MFQPSYFKQKDSQHMLSFIKQHPMASIVTLSSTGLVGNHVPMMVIKRKNKYFLQGHVARVNSIHNDCDKATLALAMFHGPNAYISPNWYPSKKQDPKTVPTWNYVAVHVSGEIQFYESTKWLKKHLTLLSDTHEKNINQSWHISDAPDDYIEKMMKAIVGIEVEISEIKGNAKMSQNHPEENRSGVVKGLKAIGKTDVANWVENPNRYND